MKFSQLSILIVFLNLSFNSFAQKKVDTLNNNSECLCNDSIADNNQQIDWGGMQILQLGRQMAVIDKTVVRGSCWDFVNEVYRRAGSASNKTTVFKSKKSGPYANPELVKPGDWLYHINYDYTNNEHSAIFVCWKDFKKRIAVTLSYAGMNRNQPARYGTYNLRGIYSIFRPIISKPQESSIGTSQAN